MASFTRKTYNRPTFFPTTPHFFKIILDKTSRDRKLRIPKKFVMKYGDNLSNPVYLRLPSGSEWKVELRRWDGEVWFGKGWPDFTKFYSLDYGHWLVFRFEENSKFRVCIFDKSCTEIEYPLTMLQMEETRSNDGSADDTCDDSGDDSSDNSIEIFDNSPTSPRKTRAKTARPCPRPHKKSRTSSSGKYDFPNKNGGGITSCAQSGDSIALQRARAFKSQNPTFIVVIRPSYINLGMLCLPSKFYKLRHIKKSCEVILRVSNGRTWPVDLKYVERRSAFRHGWIDFVLDNSLELGDVCVFESINNCVKPLFDVVIFRSREAAESTMDLKQTVRATEESDEDDSVEILDD